MVQWWDFVCTVIKARLHESGGFLDYINFDSCSRKIQYYGALQFVSYLVTGS